VEIAHSRVEPNAQSKIDTATASPLPLAATKKKFNQREKQINVKIVINQLDINLLQIMNSFTKLSN
jgi:hypothetical protein